MSCAVRTTLALPAVREQQCHHAIALEDFLHGPGIRRLISARKGGSHLTPENTTT